MYKRELANELLNEVEKLSIQQFIANPVMCEAVKKVLLVSLYSQGILEQNKSPLLEKSFWIRTRIKILSESDFLLEEGFNLLSTFKKENKVESDKNNPAR